MEDHRVQDGFFAWRDIMAYKAQRIGKRARRQNLSLSEYPPSSVNMNVQSDMDDSQCSETESILSAASSASGSRTSRSTNTSFSLSTGCECDTDDDDIFFPSYNDDESDERNVDPEASSALCPESPEPLERAEDDTAIRVDPSRHVDYLSHDWREEDILPSWRHVVSNRKTYSNSSRLENAAWRTWEKTRSNLRTVPADSLNWLKDCDVTWLYGPLQISSYQSTDEIDASHDNRPPRPNSPAPIKPSLKKRSMSEIMLQKSRSASALLKQATAAVQAQRSVRSTSWKTIGPLMGESPRLLTSMSSPELTSPCVERNSRNVRFLEQVEQCIAVDLVDEDDLERSRPIKYSYYSDNDYDSDDGIMMFRSRYIRGPRAVVEPKLEFTPSTRKLIETLPSTLLKSREEDPKSHLQLLKRSGKLSSHQSQETLRPINASQILPGPNNEDEAEFDWFSPTTFSSKFSYDEVELDDQAEEELSTDTGSHSQSHASSINLISGVETKISKDEKICSKCFLQPIPSWRNCDMCPECIRTLVLDDGEYDDPTTLDFSRPANIWEKTSMAEETSQDIALVASSWTEEISSPTLHDYGPNESDLVSFALPLRFARGVELSSSDPGNSLAEPEDSKPADERPSECAEEAEAEEESSPSPLSSEYYGSESGDTGSDNSIYHDLCDMSNSHSETDLIPILDPMKQALVDRIMEEFWGIFNQEDSRFIGCVGNTPQSSAPSSSASSPNSSASRSVQRKRQRDDEDDGRSPNDGNGRKPRQPRNGQPSTSDPDENKRLACPFRKHDSRKYSVYNHRACALSHWDTISRVKEHIYRCHQKAIHCKRCWLLFKTQQQLDSHITVASSSICEVQPGSPPDGITPEIERKLRSRKKTHPNQSEEDRWREMYRLLFPNSQVPSPYFASPQDPGRLSPDSHHLAAYESYMRHELPRLVRSNIEDIVQHQMQPFEASLVGNLVGIIQDCQDRVFRSYRDFQSNIGDDVDVVAMPRQILDGVLEVEAVEGEAEGGGEGETGDDFIAEIFQPMPMTTEAVVGGNGQERYAPDPRLFELCEDPMHLVPSDSGYGSEQICGCVYLCNCANSSGRRREDRNGEVTREGDRDMAWQEQGREQDWCLYPEWNGADLMDDELHWEGSA